MKKLEEDLETAHAKNTLLTKLTKEKKNFQTEKEQLENENNKLEEHIENLFTLGDNDFDQWLNESNETSTSTTEHPSNSFFFPAETNDNKQNKQLFEFNYSSDSSEEEETGEDEGNELFKTNSVSTFTNNVFTLGENDFNQLSNTPNETSTSTTEHPSSTSFFQEKTNSDENSYDKIVNQNNQWAKQSIKTLESLKTICQPNPAPHQSKNMVGLQNNNNLCYRNAVLQVLKHAGLQTPMSDRITSWQTEGLQTFFDDNSQEAFAVSEKMPALHNAINKYFGGEKEQQSPVELFEKLMNKETKLNENCERFAVLPEYSFDNIRNLDKTYAIIDISQPTKNIVTVGVKETVLDEENLISAPAQIENHKLIAAIYRFGATDSGGHIISFVNKQGTWYVCDDKDIQKHQGSGLPNGYKSWRGTAYPIMALYEKSL